MTVETAVAAALLGGYVDSRLQLGKDLKTAYRVVKANIISFINQQRGRLNWFYTFEDWVNTQPNKTFIIYPEPIKGKKVHVKDGALAGNLDELFEVHSWSYKEVYDIVLKYSAIFRHKYGIQPGEIVTMDFVNKAEFIFIWLALWNLGAVPAFLNYNLQGKALLHCVEVVKSRLLLVDEEVEDNVRALSSELEDAHVTVAVVNTAFKDEVAKAQPFRLPDEQRPIPALHDPAMYIYTSGTTGLPKAAVMSWRKVQLQRVYVAITRILRSDVIYSAMPLYHSTAAMLGFVACLSEGGTFAIGHKFSTTTFWTQVKLCGATVIQYVGETGRYLLNAPTSVDERNHKVRQAMGNGLRPDIWARFKDRFNIPIVDEFYGATEFPLLLNNHQVGEFGIGACGSYGELISKGMDTMRFRIGAVDPETLDLWRDPKTNLCRKAAPDEPGELLFKVPADDVKSQFQGYHGNQKATDEKVIFDVFSKGDAYVRSGDLLRLTSDKLLCFVDRLGDTFRWKSENVSTNEVEEAITEDNDIKEAVVVGIRVPNHEGRAGFAVIESAKPNRLPDMEALGKRLLARLPKYAVPIFVKVATKGIEKTGNNKVQKKQFRAQKIPSADEEIFWLVGDKYEPLTVEAWKMIESGKTKL